MKSPVQATLVDADGADVGSVAFSGLLSNHRFKSVPDDGWTKGLWFCYEIRDPQGRCLRRIAGPTERDRPWILDPQGLFLRRIVEPDERDRCVTVDNTENGNRLASIVKRPRAKGYDILADGGRVGSLNYALTRVLDRGGHQVARIKGAGLRFGNWIAIDAAEPLDEPFASVAILAALCRDFGPGPGGG